MVYVIDFINKKAAEELGIQETVIERYMIDLIDYELESRTVRQLIKAIKGTFNKTIKMMENKCDECSKYNEYHEYNEDNEELIFDNLSIKEKVKILEEGLSKALDIIVSIYPYQDTQKDLEMTV